MKRHKPTGSLGQAFAKMLRTFEFFEGKYLNAKRVGNTLEVKMTDSELPMFGGLITQLLDRSPNPERWLDRISFGLANDAARLRSSFKFRADHDELIDLANYTGAGEHLMYLPFDLCTLVLDEVHRPGDAGQFRQVCLYLDKRAVDEAGFNGDWYEQQGLALGDHFVSVQMGVMSERDFYYVPAEFHFLPEQSIDHPIWTAAVPEHSPDWIYDAIRDFGEFAINAVRYWIAALNNQATKQVSTSGLKPGVPHLPAKRKERRMYEHTMITIDPLRPRPVGDAGGHHSKHRLHPVRGFWRQYKSGKRVWVKAHWRGDKELGVVTHDYEVASPDQ